MKLTKKEAENLLKEIKEKEKELRNLRKYKGEAAENEGDGWHDNFAFEQTEIEERMLINQISEMQEVFKSIEIIEGVCTGATVQLGNTVTVELTFGEDDKEILTFYITGGIGDGKEMLSVNSPLGEMLLNKPEGYEGTYIINKNEIEFKILEIS